MFYENEVTLWLAKLHTITLYNSLNCHLLMTKIGGKNLLSGHEAQKAQPN